MRLRETYTKSMAGTYRTDESDYQYKVAETKDYAGDPYFAITIPCPRNLCRRAGRRWANSRLVKEVLEDFGLEEDRREYRNNGDTVVFGW